MRQFKSFGSRQMLENVEQADDAHRRISQPAQKAQRISAKHARDTQASGQRHLLLRCIHALEVRVSGLPQKVEERAVAASDIDNRRAQRRMYQSPAPDRWKHRSDRGALSSWSRPYLITLTDQALNDWVAHTSDSACVGNTNINLFRVAHSSLLLA